MNDFKPQDEATVSVHALEGGKFTLPERFFVTPLEDLEARRYVPSLCFLIQHYSSNPSNARDNQKNGNEPHLTRLLFDLGLRRDISRYSSSIQAHTRSRLPIDTSIDVVASLAAGGLSSDDIDMIILSHVHWDHIGLPTDFGKAKFVVGNGSLDLLNGKGKICGPHSCFEEGILPSVKEGRTVELEATTPASECGDRNSSPTSLVDQGGSVNGKVKSTNGTKLRNEAESIQGDNSPLPPWKPFSIFPSTIDLFNDGSIYIISAPGHIPGHLNLLCRTSTNPTKYVYLAADSCHDRRLLTGEKEIAEWKEEGAPDVVCCIHADRDEAKRTLSRIWEAECGRGEGLGGEVEVVFAHDAIWEEKAKKEGKFLPGKL